LQAKTPFNQLMDRVLTADGSYTLKHATMNEHYHSLHGAFAESRHVYIKHGLEAWLSENAEKKAVRVLEVGFGTGLNLLLAAQLAETVGVKLHYVGIEPFLVPAEKLRQMGYSNVLTRPTMAEELVVDMERAQDGGRKTVGDLGTHCTYEIEVLGFADFDDDHGFDVVFYDAFAPEKQPELWSDEILLKAYNHLSPGGILTTYCVKGYVKRGFRAAGGIIERLEGAPGKRQMLRVRKAAEG